MAAMTDCLTCDHHKKGGVQVGVSSQIICGHPILQQALVAGYSNKGFHSGSKPGCETPEFCPINNSVSR